MTASDSAAQPAVQAALANAASRLGLAASQLQVESVEAREWPDSSLGCPQSGTMYTQVITPGYAIVVLGSGKRLEYHSDSRGRVVLCSER